MTIWVKNKVIGQILITISQSINNINLIENVKSNMMDNIKMEEKLVIGK